MNSNLAEGYGIIRNVINGFGLSESGAAYLAKALDPFHDMQINLFGLPDTCCTKTIVREYKRQMQVSLASFPDLNQSANTWNCHIGLLPFLRTFAGTPMYQSTPQMSKVATSAGGYDGPPQFLYDTSWGNLASLTQSLAPDINQVNCDSLTEGLYPCFIVGHLAGATPFPGGAYIQPNPYVQGPFQTSALQSFNGMDPWSGSAPPLESMRCIAAAFEVINGTPDQYIGGEVSCYRVNSEFDTKRQKSLVDGSNVEPFNNGANGYFTYSYFNYTDVVIISAPLPDLQAAEILLGTKSWTAKEGVYVVQAFDPQVIDEWVSMFDTETVAVMNHFANLAASANVLMNWKPFIAPGRNFTLTLATGLGNISTAGIIPPPAPLLLTAGQTCGAMFTGLDPHTTLLVRARWMIEFCPTFDNLNDVTTAGIAAEFDPKAQELYARIVRDLPTGVKVKYNSIGEWFLMVVQKLAQIAPAIGAFVGNLIVPGAGGVVGGLVGQAGKAAGNAYFGDLEEPSKKRPRNN